MELFVVKSVDGRVLADGFEKKAAAKKERNRLTKEGTRCVISRGKDHIWGESHPTSNCLGKKPVEHGRAPENPPPGGEMPVITGETITLAKTDDQFREFIDKKKKKKKA